MFVLSEGHRAQFSLWQVDLWLRFCISQLVLRDKSYGQPVLRDRPTPCCSLELNTFVISQYLRVRSLGG